MRDSSVPLLVLSTRQDDVELINRTLRDAGHPAHCHWLRDAADLAGEIERRSPQLVWVFVDACPTPLADIAKVHRGAAPMVPLLAVGETADEAAITAAIEAGARDLVSPTQTQRLRAIAERELRFFRMEHAFNETLQSSAHYKRQLKSLMAGAVDAIADVQEGIIVEANQAWADLFGFADVESALLPLMDCIDAASQAALKTALSACLQGGAQPEPLELTGVAADGSPKTLSVVLEPSQFDGDAAVRVCVPRPASTEAQAEQILSVNAETDAATGFLNRIRFVELLTDRLSAPHPGGVRALACVRPDNFSAIAEQVGPLASEEILVQIAGHIREHVRKSDLYGRFGGTAFAVLLERGTLRDAAAWCERLLQQLAAQTFGSDRGTTTVSCTIGLAEAGPETDMIETVLINAERAIQKGRQQGGNQVVLEETTDSDVQARRYDEGRIVEIKAALAENRFRLAQLPIASLSGGAGRLFDGVVRMVDPEGQEVPAAEFMPTAARNGLLRAIDRWVVNAAFELCGAQAFDAQLVKLSSDSIGDDTLINWIRDRAARLGAEPARICFQVSEADAAALEKQTLALAGQLRAAGFGFAVEHFGIGRDPMRVLEQVPMTFLKIDGSLMQSLSGDTALQAKVRKFINAAHERQIPTIAERVEDANTMAVLFQLGADYIQGHYLHEPEVVLEEMQRPQPALSLA